MRRYPEARRLCRHFRNFFVSAIASISANFDRNLGLKLRITHETFRLPVTDFFTDLIIRFFSPKESTFVSSLARIASLSVRPRNLPLNRIEDLDDALRLE